MAGASGPKLVANPMVLARELPDGAVLINSETGDCFELNRVGREIWEHVTRGESFDRIVETLADRYAIDQGVLSADVASLVDNLARNGILVPPR